MDKIRVSAAGPVREVMLARGEKRNALDAEMLDQLDRGLRGRRRPTSGWR